jgi:Tfp pilus assembly protein FimT
MEIIVTVAIILAMAAIVAPTSQGLFAAIKLRNSASMIKKKLVSAKIRAISNPRIHCGVHLDTAANRITVFFDDTLSRDYAYQAGSDEVYQTATELPSGISLAIPDTNMIENEAVVFRGDGSAKYGGSVHIKDTHGRYRIVNVLPSTGRIKVAIP